MPDPATPASTTKPSTASALKTDVAEAESFYQKHPHLVIAAAILVVVLAIAIFA